MILVNIADTANCFVTGFVAGSNKSVTVHYTTVVDSVSEKRRGSCLNKKKTLRKHT